MSNAYQNAIGLVVVGFLPYIVNFLVLPLYSQYLTPEDFGIIGIAMACMMIASTWSHLQLPSALSRLYFDYKDLEQNEYLASVINGSFLTSFLFCLLYYFFKDDIANLAFSRDGYSDVIAVSIFILLFNSLNLTLERVLINQQDGGKILARSVLCQFASVVSGVYFITVCEYGVIGFLYSQVIYYFTMSIVSFYFIRDKYKFVLKCDLLIESLKYSVPLIAHALGGVVFMYAGTFFIEKYLSLSLLGVFFIAEKFSQVIKSLVNSINNVIMPYYNKLSVNNQNNGKAFLEKLIPFWLSLYVPLVLLYVFAAELFVNDYIEGEYKGLFELLIILCFSYIFRGLYCFSSAPLFFGKKTKVIPKITIVTGLFSLAFNYFLIKAYALSGAGLAVLLSFFISFSLAHYFAKEVYRIKIRLNFAWLFVVSSVFAVVNFIVGSDTFLSFAFVNFLVVALFFVLVFFNFLKLKDKLISTWSRYGK
ncbi:lipopolysaccharide biosynthesis protein [Shewanella spartinae]|uniref:lipopolysaccharide biosynthesis protein n=1 Tax=Shewanella spartinae TaxID=2864205 RepID=UPI001C655A47|nr:oligosaccharide flippase family protein [Shewanella spartinae]QYJ95154.1 oligosaccharide flippase family protein [Shewanella spartinae]